MQVPHSSPAAVWWPAVVVAACALLFTVATFWWLNIRRGRLHVFEPRFFAAYITPELLLIRLPLVIHNDGAAPITVQDLRLVLATKSVPSGVPLEWRTVRAQMMPDPNDGSQLAAPFVVAGRSAETHFIEFGIEPGVPVDLHPCVARVEALQAHRSEWTSLLGFELHTKRIMHPNNYIGYRNASEA